VGEIAVDGYMQAGPQHCYGVLYKKNAFAREHTISTTAQGAVTIHLTATAPPAPGQGTV